MLSTQLEPYTVLSFEGGQMKLIRITRVLVILVSVMAGLGLNAAQAQTAPIAIATETAISVTFGYQFLDPSTIGLTLGYETPLDLGGFPLDISITPKLSIGSQSSSDPTRNGISFGFGTGISVVIFNSLGSDLPIAVGAWADLSFKVQPGGFGFHFGFGPMADLNLEPFHATFSLSLISLGNYVRPLANAFVYSFDINLGLRYYFDAFSIEAGFTWNTVGVFNAFTGVRFLL
jgi:hypothetical protein